MSHLNKVDLSQKFEDEKEYEHHLKKWQFRLLNLERSLAESQISALIAFEGWDAGGKGGAIKRVIERLDPRGYKVYPIAAPSEEEKKRHYLWRFWNRVPTRGELVIFDRSWYGRVLVERIDHFATEEAWQRAYDEINCFESDLTHDGTVVMKFWMHISAEEQLKRFHEREDSPFKRWKITQDDWHNREMRDQYLEAAEDMFDRTDTDHCPWHIVAAEYKWFARVEVLKTVVKRLEKALGKEAAE